MEDLDINESLTNLRGIDQINEAHDGEKWCAVVNTVMNILIPYNFVNFLTELVRAHSLTGAPPPNPPKPKFKKHRCCRHDAIKSVT
jgi:hypothetical protein